MLVRPTVTYLWDVFFLHSWRPAILRHALLALLALLRPWALRADTYDKLLKVLAEEPRRIYRSDLRRALLHLERGDQGAVPCASNYRAAPRPVESPPWRPATFSSGKGASPTHQPHLTILQTYVC